MNRIAVVTATRAEYGLLKPILHCLNEDPAFELELLVCGAHLLPAFGQTEREITADGFRATWRLPTLAAGDGAGAMSQSMALTQLAVAQTLAENRPDLALLLGDRFEMLAAALAYYNAGVPIVHLYGGETTEGALDEGFRHALTKLAQFHIVNCALHRRRVIQMGEEPWRVMDCGDTCLENLRLLEPTPDAELSALLAFDVASEPFALCTFHPETQGGAAREQIVQLVRAIEMAEPPLRFVFTKANADAGGQAINACLEEAERRLPRLSLHSSFGSRVYLSLMKKAAVVLGNSSSGLTEAPYLKIPTVDIGARQQGRLAATSVIHCDCEPEAIQAALARAFSPEFREICAAVRSPFGDGYASRRIIAALTDFLGRLTRDRRTVMRKRFFDCLPAVVDLPAESVGRSGARETRKEG